MNREKLQELIDKYLTGEASVAEEKALFSYYDKLQSQELKWNEAQMGEEELVKDTIYNNILLEIKRRERKKTVSQVSWMLAASLALAILSTAVFYLAPLRIETTSENMSETVIEPEVQPGGNKAVLTLADGSKITLDTIATGELPSQSGIHISKLADGRLIYRVSESSEEEAETQSVYNVIETPLGGQYRVDLSDGTRVWLNAASSLHYPAKFSGNVRRVELRGEAYFEVAKNENKPFRVVSNMQVVEVLGTHFNISSYADEAYVRTTLLEGSVSVALKGTRSSELLKPGQQAVIGYGDDSILVQPVDVEEAVAWQKGYFMFVDEDLKSVMRQLARWYNVEVIYEGDLEKLKFGGMISRSKSIGQALRILELTGNVQFKVEGRRITVMQ